MFVQPIETTSKRPIIEWRGQDGFSAWHCGSFELPMSRRDIADYLGLTLEISRGFFELQKKRALELSGARHVALRNRSILKAINS